MIKLLKRKNSLDYLDKIEGMISKKEAQLLFDLAKSASEGCIVEVGSYRGKSTTALALGSLDGLKLPVYAIDPHEDFTGILGAEFGPEDRAAFFRNIVKTYAYKVVRLINYSSECFTKGWEKPVSLLWLDGDHTYEGVKKDFYSWLPFLIPDCKIAFDDSLNKEIGPYKLINELIQSAEYKKVKTVGKVTVITKSL